MADHFSNSSLGWLAQIGGSTGLPTLFSYLLPAALFLAFASFRVSERRSKLPLLNPRKIYEPTDFLAKIRFLLNAKVLVGEWFAKNPNGIARVSTEIAPVTILPSTLAKEIRNDPRLGGLEWLYKAFHGYLRGFEGFRGTPFYINMLERVLKQDLTRSVGKVIGPLNEEAELAFRDHFGTSQEWHSIPVKDTVLEVVSRVTSRVFLGEGLCRNEEWLAVSRDYTVTVFLATLQLRIVPESLRPIAQWIIPQCGRARSQVRKAHQIMEQAVRERRQQKAELREKGEDDDIFDDSIEWFEREAQGNPYEPEIPQIMLSMASTHTSTDLLSQVITDIAQHPDIIEPLREEITMALINGKIEKESLSQMNLLDSVIKESQRMKPLGIISMLRLALEDVTLSDGTVIPKGEGVAVSMHRMWDPALHASPHQWDGYRFLRMREASKQAASWAQLVSTSPDHMGFGYGTHACPGRFFAAHAVKSMMAQMLIQYDWRLLPKQTPKVRYFGHNISTDPTIQIEIRRR
ncbi:cytochrome P450 [Xylariales sp. PMI_506]|nr:cytochrome P450 [Xylariales sp. PMI_506]